MKATSATIGIAVVLTFLLSFILSTYGQAPSPLRSQTLASRRASLRESRRTDANLPAAKVNPILERVVDMAAGTQVRPGAADELTRSLRRSAETVRTVDFHLKDGKLLYGKLLDEDKNKVTLEHVEGSTIIVSTYSKRDIDQRSVQTKSVPASRYYQDLAEYFAGRTWDFKDDPDDFIQAIRCYETAKRSITDPSEADAERIRQMDEKIVKLKADRDVWSEEVQSRAKLKELEFQSEFQTRFDELEAKIEASTETVDKAVERIDKIITELQTNQQKLDQNLPLLEQEVRRQLTIMGDQVEDLRRRMDPFYRYPDRRYYPNDYNRRRY